MTFEQEANQLLREGFDDADSTWRLYATIRPVRKFEILPAGETFPQTYTRFCGFRPQEIEGGAYREFLRNLGRQCAQEFNKVFWGVVSDCGGPGLERKASLTARSLDAEMEGVRVEVCFLNGVQYPFAEECASPAEGFRSLRLTCDFGVNELCVR